MSQTTTANTTANTAEPKPKLTRAEQNRLNGSKSKGPKTEAGKARSSMNATKHASRAEVNLAWLPVENGVLSLEDRDFAFALFDAFRIHCNPQTALEITFVKKMAFHQWNLDRLDKIEQALMQTNLDATLPNLTKQSRETCSAEPPDAVAFAHAYTAMVQASDRTLRQLDRDRRTHQRALRDYARRLKELKKDFPPAVYEEIGSELLASHFGLDPEHMDIEDEDEMAQHNEAELDIENKEAMETDTTNEPNNTEDGDFENDLDASEQMNTDEMCSDELHSEELHSDEEPDPTTDEPNTVHNSGQSHQTLTEDNRGDVQAGVTHQPEPQPLAA